MLVDINSPSYCLSTMILEHISKVEKNKNKIYYYTIKMFDMTLDGEI